MKQFMAHNVLRTTALCLLVFVAGCGGIAPAINPTDTVPAITETSTPFATATIVLPSPTVTATTTPVEVVTSTPVPTLPPDEAQAKVLDLLENNAGCRLPCWWGFTPGRDEWEIVRQNLLSFATEMYIPPSSNPSHFFAEAVFLVPKEIFPTYLTQKYQVRDGIIETIETIPGYQTNYNLSTFLSTYGAPSEVWLRTYSQAREGDLPFDTVLFYPDQGILARYDSQASDLGDQIKGCPQQKPALVLALWSPEKQLTFLEAASQTVEIRNEDWWPYRPLQEATGMGVATFYETFRNADNTTCLETPAELWPQP